MYGSCILFHFYIKPQLCTCRTIRQASCILFHFYIKPQHRECCYHHRNSCILFHFYIKPQLLAVINYRSNSCILFHFYIKPQLSHFRFILSFCCILFHFYIKPQLAANSHDSRRVVSYSISTSNHNAVGIDCFIIKLYLIPFLHQTTTLLFGFGALMCCILFHFYIKPQPIAHKTLFSSTLSPKSHSHFQRNAVV